MTLLIQNKFYNGFQSLKAEAKIAVGFLGNHKVAVVGATIGYGAAFTTGCVLNGKSFPLGLAIFGIGQCAIGSLYSNFLTEGEKKLQKQFAQHAKNDVECFTAGLKQGAKETIVKIPIMAAIFAIYAGRAILR